MALSLLQLTLLRLIAASDRGVAVADLETMLQAAERSTAVRAGQSSVYAAVKSLQRGGYIAAEWDLSESHARRVFQATEKADTALEENGMGTFKVGERVQVRLPAVFHNLSGRLEDGPMRATDYISLGDDDPWEDGVVQAARPDGDYIVEVQKPPVENFRFVAVSPRRLRRPRG